MSILTTSITATTLSLALVFTGGIAASAAPAGATPSSLSTVTAAGECSFGQHLLHVWLRLPADLRVDLQALKTLPIDERRDEIRDIREDALQGDYGPGVQAKAERIRAHSLAAWTTMPADLRADLLELRGAEPEERRVLAEQIAQNALAGDYGDTAQATAERIRESELWQECVAD